VVVWRDQAEHASQSLSKGSRVVVMGRLQQRSWTAEDESARAVVEVVAEELGPSNCGGRRRPRPGRRAARASSQFDQRCDERDAKHASVPLRPVRASEVVVRSFSTNSRPALRAASGRPPARQRHHGHRGTGPTLHSGGTTPIRQSAETEPTGSGPPSTLQIRPATPPKPSITGGQPQTIPCQGDPQPGSARRKRAASARSFAAKSSARSACSLASAARGPP
jgi:single-stranded DNA-binding protein